MKVTIEKRSAYGKERLYIVEAEPARLIKFLTGKKTMTQLEIESFKKLGVDIQIKK